MSLLLTGLDTETTGLDASRGDRIIEINMQIWRWEDRKRLINWTQRINNDGTPIAKKAQDVHKISAADLVGKPLFKDVAAKISRMLAKTNALVIHNAAFDVGFLVHEMQKAKAEMPMDIAIFDTMSEGMFASYDSKPPSLAELCWSLDVPYDASLAHAADYDVDVMMQAFFNGVDRGYFDISDLIAKKAA